MAKVILYGTQFCGFCVRAEQLLARKGVKFVKIDIGTDALKRQEMIQRSGRRSVPQIFINDAHIGGFDDLAALDRSGGLDSLLAQSS